MKEKGRNYILFVILQILFLGKVADELVVKVVEVKKIQGNAHIGSIKCFTREFFSFHPMVSLVRGSLCLCESVSE